MPDTTKCKMCGRQHPVDSYREMRFYVCPDTLRVYLVAKQEDKDEPDENSVRE